MLIETDLTREQLQETQELLQRAHDRIETRGFNIWSYSGCGGGPACYIGSLRIAAGLPGNPPPAGEDEGLPHADAGGNAALAFAFDVLDQMAPEPEIGYLRERGRKVEAYGAQRDGSRLSDEAEALRIFRLALTEVYNQLQELDRLDEEAAQLQPAEREKALA